MSRTLSHLWQRLQPWFVGSLGLAVVSGLGWRSPLLAAPLCAADLEPQINAILQQQPAIRRAHWGIVVAPVAGGEPLYTRSAEQFFIPASNIKLLTTAAALQHFGPAHRVRTTVYGHTEGGETTVQIVGQGDPTLTAASLQTLAQQVAQQLPRLGATAQIDRLILDDTYFQGDAINPNWEWEDLQAGYGAPVTSLILDGNAIHLRLTPQQIGQPLQVAFASPLDAQDWALENRSRTVAPTAPEEVQVVQDGQRQTLQVLGQLRTGSAAEDVAIATPTPTLRFLRHFRAALIGAGLTVRRAEVAPQPSALPQTLALQMSPPLAEWVAIANAESENLYAETLLYLIGHDRAIAQTSTLAAGIVGVEAILAELGVDPTGIDQADGSGLSRKNLATPTAFVQTLQAMHRSPYGQVYRDSLAVAGVSGTLRNRFQGTPVVGRLQGKSGAISGIAALSGYLTPPHHPPLAFSILVNHFDQPVRAIRPSIDDIVVLLADLEACP